MDRARSAVIANASVVRLLVTVRTTPIVTLERIVVGEFVRHHTVVGVAELFCWTPPAAGDSIQDKSQI